MKKSEELEKLCPPPKPSDIAGLSLTATTATVRGRYINGQVMTVAMWDGKKSPLIVWRFCGDYWTGVRRNKETYLPALRIENVCQEMNRHSIPVSKEDDTRIRAYFCNVNYARIEDVIRYGQWQSNEKKKARREELREHGLKYWMSREPEEPKDFEQRIRRANRDIMLLWVGVETEIEVDTAGAHKIKVQKCHCDVCGADFKDYGPKWYAHKESVKCPKCGEELTVHLERYGAKKKNTSRVFLFGQKNEDGYWLKAYNVWFDYTSKRCTLDVSKREVYLLGPNVHYGLNYDWHGNYYYPVMRTTFVGQLFRRLVYKAHGSQCCSFVFVQLVLQGYCIHLGDRNLWAQLEVFQSLGIVLVANLLKSQGVVVGCIHGIFVIHFLASSKFCIPFGKFLLAFLEIFVGAVYLLLFCDVLAVMYQQTTDFFLSFLLCVSFCKNL